MPEPIDDPVPQATGLAPQELQSRALRGVTWSSVSGLLALPLAIVVSVVLARTLGPAGYARFAYLTFVVPLVISLSDLGFAQAVTRSLSGAFASGDEEGTRVLLGKAVGWNLLRLPLLCVVVLVIARPGLAGGILVVAFLVLSTLGAGLVFSLQAENRGAVLAKLALVGSIAISLASMAAAGLGADPTMVWAVSFASAGVVVPGWLIVANPALRRAALSPRIPLGMPPGTWRFGLLALASSTGSVLVFSRSEVVILDAFGEQQALAVFALAYGLSQRLTTPIDTLLGPLTTALSGLHAAHPDRFRAGFERALRLSAIAAAGLAAAALVGVALLAPIMYGEDYEGVGSAFLALAAVSLLQSIAQPYTALVYATDRLGVLLRSLVVALVVDVGAALLLIPPLGLWGAVLANVAGGIVALALVVRHAAGPASLRRAGVPAARLSALVLAACAAAYGAGRAGGLVHVALGPAAAFIAGPVTFLGLVVASGGLLPEGDVKALLGMLPRRLAIAAPATSLIIRRNPGS